MKNYFDCWGKARFGALFSSAIISGLILSGSILSARPASAKNQEFPQKIDIVILDDLQEKKNPLTLDLESEAPRPEFTIKVDELSERDLENAEKYLSTKDDIRLSVNRYKGTPAAVFPIQVPPGTNGMTPNLAIEIGNEAIANGQASGMTIAGAAALQICGKDKSGLCLGEQSLIAVKGAEKGSLYRLAADPRLTVRKTEGGYVLGNGNGITESYRALTPETAKTGPWRLMETVDWYGNFIHYFYNAKADVLTDVFYGQKDAAPENLRSLHILYDEKAPSQPLQISAMLGTRQVHSYVLKAGNDGHVGALTECASGDKGLLYCRPEISFKWNAGNGQKTARLAATNNGYGGTAAISYQEFGDAAPVAKIAVSGDGKVMQTTSYHFKDPVMEDGKTVGFEQSVAMDDVTSAGDVITYGKDHLAGVKLKEGSFIGNPAEPQMQAAYNYVPLNNDPANGYILKSIVNSRFGEKGRLLSENTESRNYDAKGRIKSVTGKIGETTINYLDETKTNVTGDAGNLVTKRSYRNRQNGNSHGKEWEYVLAAGVPQKSTVRAFINGKEQPSLAQEMTTDDHGNVVAMRTGKGESNITYDEKYRTFPEKVTGKAADGKGNYVTSISYDPAFGVELATVANDGSATRRKLDAFGEVQEVTSTAKSPLDTAASSKAEAVVNETRNWSSGRNGDRLLTVTSTISNTLDQEKAVTVVKTHFDGLNRPVRIDGEKSKSSSKETHLSSLVNQYRPNGRTTRITDETGMMQEIEYDKLGRLIEEKTPAYGDYKISYDEAGNIGQIVRSGKTISYQYDDEGRLTGKTLPGNRTFTYEYDKALPAKIAAVTLPGGQRIEYRFTASGQTASKTLYVPGPDQKSYKFTTAFTYANTRLKTVTYPDGSEVTYDYADDYTAKAIRWTKGAPASWKNSNVPIVSYQTGDAEDGDRLLLKDLGNGIQEIYSWSPNGRLNEISVGKPQSKKDSGAHSLLNLAYTSYTESGLLKAAARKDIGRKETDQFVRNFEYGDTDDLTAVKETLNGKATAHGFAYDKNDSLTADTQLNNKYIFKGDGSYQLTSSSNDTRFQYDANHNIQTIAGKAETSTYDFDVENRLLAASVTRGGRQVDTTFVYDHLGERLVKAVKGGAVTTYVDPFFEFTLLPDGKVQQTRYVWDVMGRVAAFTETVSKDRFLAAFPIIPGKTVRTGAGASELVAMPEPDTKPEKLMAAFMGLLPQKIQAISPLITAFLTTLFILTIFEAVRRKIQDDPVIPVATGRLERRFIAVVSGLVIVSFLGSLLAPSALAALESGDGTPKADQVTFFHHDIRGSVVAVTDEAGNQTASVNYRPYGAIDDSVLSSGNNNFRYKFAGMEYDDSTGLYYDHARYYHPGIKRFISPDIARQTIDPYSYTAGDPVNFVDPNGRMRQHLLLDESSESDTQENQTLNLVPLAIDRRDTIDDGVSNLSMLAQLAGNTIQPKYGTLAAPEKKDPLDWVRYPTFFRMTYGVKKGYSAPEPVAPTSEQPTKEETEAFNQRARSGFMQGWTRTGGYIQSIFSAVLLAWWFPTSYTYDSGKTVTAGFWTDLAIYAMTVTAFSGYGKAYTANASAYWNNFLRQGATWKDYLKLSLRRVVHKAVVQVIAFTGITLFGRYARGYPIFFSDQSKTNEIYWLAIRNLVFSTFGSVLMLSYYLPTKPPSPAYDDELAENNYQNAKWDAVNNAWFLKRWYLKAAHAYRMFNGRKGFWAREHPESKFRNMIRNSWYAWYVTQMYVWYVIGSAAYYTGLATLLGTHPDLTKSDFLLSWRGNLTQVILSPAASPLAYLNFWHRKSFTIVKKRSLKSVRTPKGSWSDWFWYKILGPIDGLRIAKFDDAAFISKDDWLTEMRQVNDLEMGSRENGNNDPISSNIKPTLPEPKNSYDELNSDSNGEQKENSPSLNSEDENSQNKSNESEE